MGPRPIFRGEQKQHSDWCLPAIWLRTKGLHRLQSDEDGSQGDVCPHAEASQAGGVGEVAEEAGARQGVIPQAHRPRQDHTRPTGIVSNAAKFPNIILWYQIIYNNKYIFLSIPFHIVALRVKQFEQ